SMQSSWRPAKVPPPEGALCLVLERKQFGQLEHWVGPVYGTPRTEEVPLSTDPGNDPTAKAKATASTEPALRYSFIVSSSLIRSSGVTLSLVQIHRGYLNSQQVITVSPNSCDEAVGKHEMIWRINGCRSQENP